MIVATHPLWRPFAAGSNAARQSQRVAHRQIDPGPPQAYDPRWTDAFTRVLDLVTRAVGTDCPLRTWAPQPCPG